MRLAKHSAFLCLLLFNSSFACADYKVDIGFNRLATELGANMPDGTGVLVTQAEAATSFVDHDNNPSTADLPVYLPDSSNSQFTGKSIVDISGFDSGTYSGHATSVGTRFYGTNAIASGINSIEAHWADYWLQPGYLNYGGSKPLSAASRVANHSWIASVTDLAVASNILRRIDWVVETDEYIQAVGSKNNSAVNSNLFAAAYNVIAVGKSDGIHGNSTPAVDSTYVSGRARPEIVAPFTNTSSSTPVISAAAALLIEAAHSNPALSTDPVENSTSNRNGDPIYNAERSEVIKAALLAGADRLTKNTTTYGDISEYRSLPVNQTDNGLDARYGAGQVNVYNSYHIIAAGEQNSSEDGGAGATGIAESGFDYDPSFGGSNGSNNVASYSFSTGADPVILAVSLVWNIEIDGGSGPNFSGAATFYDLDLILYDVTSGQVLLNSSSSVINNTENIWTTLAANRDYLLQVIPKSGQGNFNWDYGLAWNLALDSDGDAISDLQDNCPADANSGQEDLDGDNTGDACDPDIDGDGTSNGLDAFPYDPAETTDTDNDGIGNNADLDDDDDGLDDTLEQTVGTNPLLFDTDSDGFSDGVEVAAGSDPLDDTSVPAVADGDLNSDGTVNAADVLLAQQILTGLLSPTADQLSHGDVAPLVSGSPSPDGAFNVGDLVVIQRKALGVIDF